MLNVQINLLLFYVKEVIDKMKQMIANAYLDTLNILIKSIASHANTHVVKLYEFNI